MLVVVPERSRHTTTSNGISVTLLLPFTGNWGNTQNNRGKKFDEKK